MERYLSLMNEARTWIESRREDLIRELQDWSRIPSVSRADLAAPGMPFGPDCRKMLDFAMERGAAYGYQVQDHEGCACSLTMGDAENAIGIIAHLDVVPVGDGWVYPPYGATYLPEYDVLIGRGVSDNKGPAIMSLFAMEFLKEKGYPLKHGISLFCGTSEETGMQDMQMLLAHGMRFPKVSLVPDAFFPVNYGQKGSIDGLLSFPCTGNLLSFDSGSVRNVIPDLAECTVALPEETVRAAFAALPEDITAPITITAAGEHTKISASGRSGHAAFPAGGANAILHLTRALAAADILTGDCAAAIREIAALTADPYGQSEGVAYRDEMSGDLTLVYGVAHLVDGVMTLSVDCRSSITCDGDRLEADLRADWARRGAAITHFERTAPFYIPKDDPRVQAMQTLYHAATGRDDEPYTMGGGTYSRVVPNAISFGPGIPGSQVDRSAYLPEGHGGAHGRDETVDIEKLCVGCSIYAAAIAALDDLTD